MIFFLKVADQEHKIIIFMPKKVTVCSHCITEDELYLIRCALIHSYETPVSETAEFWWVTNMLTPIVVKFLNLIYSGLTFQDVLELEFISLVLIICFPETCDGPLRADEESILCLLDQL